MNLGSESDEGLSSVWRSFAEMVFCLLVLSLPFGILFGTVVLGGLKINILNDISDSLDYSVPHFSLLYIACESYNNIPEISLQVFFFRLYRCSFMVSELICVAYAYGGSFEDNFVILTGLSLSPNRIVEPSTECSGN